MTDRQQRVPGVPVRWSGRADEHIRKVAEGVNELFKGKSNNHYKVTLRAGTAKTVIQTPGGTVRAVPTLAPLDAQSAATITQIYAVPGSGTVTVFHDSNTEDRELGVIVVG